MYRSLLALTLLASANAACDNSCSGHGNCEINDVCKCFDGWAQGITHMSGDCSDRMCPFDFAFVSNPTNMTKRHEYLECAGKGICNRESGECECFPGYEGEGCGRTACPNDCSGHGRCSFIDDIPKYGMISDHKITTDYYTSLYLTEENYKGWDSLKTRGCVCDPGYIDEDCSKRMCPFGDDPMTVRLDQTKAAVDQTQTIQLKSWNAGAPMAAGGRFSNGGRTFSLIYMNIANETFNTAPIVFPNSQADCHAFANQIQNALYLLPTKVIETVIVAASCEDLDPEANMLSDIIDSTITTINITFTGPNNEGKQHNVMANTRTCLGAGCHPIQDGLNIQAPNSDLDKYNRNYPYNSTEIVMSDKESDECGNRGKCDYTVGECKCFQGYSGQACGVITAIY